jgi:hypothetical protein
MYQLGFFPIEIKQCGYSSALNLIPTWMPGDTGLGSMVTSLYGAEEADGHESPYSGHKNT